MAGMNPAMTEKGMGMQSMNNAVNNKRVFCVQPHRPIGFGEALGKRGDIRLDMLEQKSPDADALEILSAAHAYQMSSARDELARHYHAGAELLGRTPNLLIVSTNGAGYDTVDMKACTEHGVLVVNQSGGNAEAVAEHVIGMMLCLIKRMNDSDRALRTGTLKNRNDYTGHEAYGRTIGIVGLGNVGKRVAAPRRSSSTRCSSAPTSFPSTARSRRKPAT